VRRALAAAAAALVVAMLARGAAADDLADYDPTSQAWNGMASFVSLAEGMGFEVVPKTQLDWNELGDTDILFLVYPLARVDPARLGQFVQAGGNVVLADDFGAGRDAMAALGLLRADTGTPRASKFAEDRVWAPIATHVAHDHPIGDGVHDVVTNHPAALEHVAGAQVVVAFDEGALVAAGERGTGRFVAVSDPSIFINKMMLFGDNLRLTANILRWLDRGGHARRIILLRGDAALYGDPKPYIYDARGGPVGRSIAGVNSWLGGAHDWLLTTTAMKALAAVLAVVLVVLAALALPIRRGAAIDGAWLRFPRVTRRDEPHALVAAADRPTGGTLLVVACMMRDQLQDTIAQLVGRPEPLFTVPESELVALVTRARGPVAGDALGRVYRALRALPSRGQAAAPWSTGQLTRREFDALYDDVAELCRTLDG
jgi:hypothetical protein